jgi:glycerol transport system substrate-binding protein
MRKYLLCAVAASAVIAGAGSAFADEAAAQKWIDQEFQPSVLTKDEQLAEMQWFIRRPNRSRHGDQRAVGRHSDALLRV